MRLSLHETSETTVIYAKLDNRQCGVADLLRRASDTKIPELFPDAESGRLSTTIRRTSEFQVQLFEGLTRRK